jgi:uncharacterized RDD family membrane protein YckC
MPTLSAPASTTGAPPRPSALTGPLVPAGAGVRLCAFLLDLAVLISPLLPIALSAKVLGSPGAFAVVGPTAVVAVWVWMSLWQGYTGMSFGKSLMGVRSIRAADRAAPGCEALVVRAVIFAGSAGLAVLPVLFGQRDGWHDRLSGVTLVDVTLGPNPLGPQQQAVLRRGADRSLRRVSSPVPVGPTVQRAGGR